MGRFKAWWQRRRDERVVDLNRRLKQARADIKKARADIKLLASEANALETTVKERDEQIRALHKKVEEDEHAITSLQDDLRKSDSEVTLLKMEVNHLLAWRNKELAAKQKETAIYCMETEAAKRGGKPRTGQDKWGT